MSTSGSNRREMMIATIGVGLGSLLPSAQAQLGKAGTLPPIAQLAGQRHERTVARLREVLGSDGPDTEKGLHKLVDFLEKLNFINDFEDKLLHELIETLYAEADLERLESKIENLLEEAKAKAKDLTITIISVALSSVRSVSKEVTDHKRAIFIISSDVSGACLGAAACWELGPWIAVASALSGAVTGSCTAWYGSR